MSCSASLSPVVMYHGLGRRYLLPPRFLMRPQPNGGTLGGRDQCTELEDEHRTLDYGLP